MDRSTARLDRACASWLAGPRPSRSRARLSCAACIARAHRDRGRWHVARLSCVEDGSRREHGNWRAPQSHGSALPFCSTPRRARSCRDALDALDPAKSAPVVEARDLVFPLQRSHRTRTARRRICKSPRAIAWCWKARRAAENRRWFPCWPACASPAPGAFSCTASIARRSAPPNGAGAWPQRRSSMRITCWPKHSRSICS